MRKAIVRKASLMPTCLRTLLLRTTYNQEKMLQIDMIQFNLYLYVVKLPIRNYINTYLDCAIVCAIL